MLIRIIYASTSGNVESVVEKTSHIWQAHGLRTSLHRAEQSNISLFQNTTHFLLATSTWEHGELNPFFRALLKEMKQTDFTGKSAAFVGLGDTRYEPVYFCQGMETVKNVWERQHGQVIAQPLKINGEPYHLLQSVVKDWAVSVARELVSTEKPVAL
jgi:flavodoxin